MLVDKDHIRLVKCSYNTDGKYWYHPEILISIRGISNFTEWIEPYAVNYKTLSTRYKLESISPRNEYQLKKFLEECLSWVNTYHEMDGWKIVDKCEYNKVLEQFRIQKENQNKYVYL